MLTREKKLLELLLKGERTYTTNELANLLHVSPRTVKKDVKRAREELKLPDCRLNSQAGKGIWLTCTEEGKKFVNKLIMTHDDDSFAIPENRKYYVLLKLLDAKTFLSMESIADSLYVSKGTVVNDVGEIVPFLKKQGLTLEKRAKYGIRILGKESRVRLAKSAVIGKLVKTEGSGILQKLQPFFKTIDLYRIHKCLHDMEDHYDFTFADMSYTEMVVNVAILIERNREGMLCQAEEAELEGYKRKTEWEIAGYLARGLENAFDVRIEEGEKAYLAMNLLGAKLQNSYKEESIRILSREDSIKLDEILKMAEKVYHEYILEDQLLKNALYMHLEGMFNRLNYQIHMDNPMKQTVKEDLAYEYDIATYIAKLIYEQLDIKLGDNEICDIALYLGAGFERRKAARSTFAPTVVIACGTGMGTSLYFEARLKRIFPDITIRKVLPVSRISEEIGRESQECVISTIPLTLEGINVINVSPVLSDKDIETIRAMLYPVENEVLMPERNQYPRLFSLLNEKITILKCDCKSKEEAIGLLGQRMVMEGYAGDGFIESVLKREKLSPTSIGDTFAIPHAFEGYVQKTGIGLMTLKKPVIWGEERVQIILMLAVDSREGGSLKDIFGELADLTKNHVMIRKILEAERFRQLK